MHNDVKAIILFSIVFSILLISNVGAEMLVSEAGVRYDSKISESFNNLTFAQEEINDSNGILMHYSNGNLWIRVIVELKDNSRIEIIGNKTEKRELTKQRDELFEPKIDEFISLPAERKLLYFSGE